MAMSAHDVCKGATISVCISATGRSQICKHNETGILQMGRHFGYLNAVIHYI